MAYNDRETEVLRKYGILESDGSLRKFEPLETPDAEEISSDEKAAASRLQPIINPNVIRRLLSADKTPNQEWIDWIFHEAGGGSAAEAISLGLIEHLRTQVIRNKMEEENMTLQNAQDHWSRYASAFQRELSFADESIAKADSTASGVFAYFKDWPGRDGIYKKVVETLSEFLKLRPSINRFNREMVAQGKTKLSTTPAEIPDVDAMLEIIRKTKNFAIAQRALTQKNVEVVYDDKVITAMVPLTHAAAVHFGYRGWPWSNRQQFVKSYAYDKPYGTTDNPWLSILEEGKIILYLVFKIPTPIRIMNVSAALFQPPAPEDEATEELKTSQRYVTAASLNNLCLVLDHDMLQGDIDEWPVWDWDVDKLQGWFARRKDAPKPGRTFYKRITDIGDVKEMLLNEPYRVDTEEEEASEVSWGRRCLTSGEAEEAVQSLDRALNAFKEWEKSFDRKRLEAARLIKER